MYKNIHYVLTSWQIRLKVINKFVIDQLITVPKRLQVAIINICLKMHKFSSIFVLIPNCLEPATSI